MSKTIHHGHQRHVSVPIEAKAQLQQQQQQFFAGADLTPGRDPAEGPDIGFSSPIHERWAQDTFDRDPAEGPAFAWSKDRKSTVRS